MSTLTLIGRLGRDSELRYTADGKPLCNLAVAYNYGRKGQDGKRPSQWVDATLFGKHAEAIINYLVKGQQVYLVLDDVHVRTYQKSDGSEGNSISGTVSKIELAGSAPQSQAQRHAPQKAPSANNAAYSDMEDDSSIPF